MLVYIQSIIAIGIGIIATVTDFKKMKIYNKDICKSIVLSILIYMIFIRKIEYMYVLPYILNVIISVIISFLFYYFKIWSAGDAKLFLAIIIIIPYELYEVDFKNVFPAIYLMILIFSIAFIYVFAETIVLWIKDEKRFCINNFINISIKDFFIQYFMGYFIIMFINNITYKAFLEFKMNNGSLIMICNMLILLCTYRFINTKKKCLITLCIFLLLNIIYYCIFGISISTVDFKILFIVVVIMLFRAISEKYNYKEIRIDELRPRMILTYGSVLNFYSSKVKGLPKTTTESTDSRLTEDEVKSIMRWSKTKKGKDTITIVRHMPFAPFICLGEILFFILKLYTGEV